MRDPAPLIVSALLGEADFHWLNGLRQAHFPPARNHLPAHLTLFHHLPPSALDEVRNRLRRSTDQPAPPATASALMNLGGGTAIRIASPGLELVRAELADAFTAVLTPQDRAGWRPHVTIQNKVDAAEAKALQVELSAGFRERPIHIAGIGLYAYRNGPWELLSRHAFRR